MADGIASLAQCIVAFAVASPALHATIATRCVQCPIQMARVLLLTLGRVICSSCIAPAAAPTCSTRGGCRPTRSPNRHTCAGMVLRMRSYVLGRVVAAEGESDVKKVRCNCTQRNEGLEKTASVLVFIPVPFLQLENSIDQMERVTHRTISPYLLRLHFPT